MCDFRYFPLAVHCGGKKFRVLNNEVTQYHLEYTCIQESIFALMVWPAGGEKVCFWAGGRWSPEIEFCSGEDKFSGQTDLDMISSSNNFYIDTGEFP